MLYFVVGPPGTFATWCGAVVAGLAGRVVGLIPIVEASTLDDISRKILSGNISHAVIAATAPGGRLRAALAAAACPFVIALDDPRLACADLVVGRQESLPVAVRQIASSCGAIMGLQSLPGALVLRGDRDWSDIQAARALADHFQFAVGDHDIAAVLEQIERDHPAPQGDDVSSWWSRLVPSEEALMRGALEPYFSRSEARRPPAISWAPELFLLGDRPTEPATSAIDITGRARCLLHGPQVLLFPGAWSLALTLGFSRDAVDNEFLVEVASDRQLASSGLRPHNEGDLTVELAFLIDDSSDYPVVIRVSTRRAAFDGAVILRGARLLRHEDAGALDAAPPDG